MVTLFNLGGESALAPVGAGAGQITLMNRVLKGEAVART
jgi:hypothetical protein